MYRFLMTSLVGLLLAASTQAQEFGDWSVDQISEEQSVYAATLNDSGGMLGKVCSKEGCYWVMTTSATCDSGIRYPALLSSSSGAGHISLVCSPNQKTIGRYIVQEFNLVDKAVVSGGVVGVAIPLGSGEFRVSRFPIRGWERASSELARRAQALLRRTGESNL